MSGAATVLEGARVLLRPPTARDAAEFLDTMNRSRRHFGHFGRPPDTRERYRRWLRSKTEKRRFLICRKDDGVIMGQIALGDIVRGLFQNAYTGYFLAKEFTGQGYATEALQLVLRHAFRDLKLHRVEANIQPDNTASIALVRRCGFRKEGVSPRMVKLGGRWRDHERWAMTVEDWRAHRARPRRR